MADFEGKLGEVEVNLAQAKSVISIMDKEIADLKVAVTHSEENFYNMGFTNAENSNEPIMFESWCYRFSEGWMAAVNVLDLPENSPSRDPEQMPLPKFSPYLPVQNQPRLKRNTAPA